MSSEKVIDTYYMVRNKWGYYLAESGDGPYNSQRITAERYLTTTGAKNAIDRFIERWQRRNPANRYPRGVLKVVKVTVRR